jgi:hypothetical protein
MTIPLSVAYFTTRRERAERGPRAHAHGLPLCSSCPYKSVTAFFRRRLTGYIMSNNNILQYKGRSFITPLITGGSW